MKTPLNRSTRRLLMLLGFLPSAVMVMGYFYMLDMTHLEGTPRTYLESLQWATETLTTTGYGHDSHWSHPVMAVYVIVGQIMGQFMVFLVFPVFVLPFFEERFETRLQHALPPMAGKVLVYRYGPAVGPLLE
jgi:voltage-gated potassium channel